MSSKGYPSDWDSRRKKIYRRDGYECQNCGVYGGIKGDAELHAHHVVPKAKGGTHDTTNLITICKGCHKAVHGNKNAPTKKSPENISSENIRDISSYLSTWKQVLKHRDLASGLLTIPTGDLNDYSDHDIAQEGQDFIKEAKNIREGLTKCRFRLRDMDLDYDDLAKRGNFENKSEFRSTIENMTQIMLEQIELLLQGVNISQEYIETVSVIVCPKCGEEEDHQSSFCGECGENLPDVWSCSDCGGIIENRGQNFCKSCGKNSHTFPETQNDRLENLENKTEDIVGEIESSGQKVDNAVKSLAGLAS